MRFSSVGGGGPRELPDEIDRHLATRLLEDGGRDRRGGRGRWHGHRGRDAGARRTGRAERPDPDRAHRRRRSGAIRHAVGARESGRRAGRGGGRVRRPARAREGAVRRRCRHDPGLHRTPEPQRRGRGHHRDARPLAPDDRDRGDECRQGCLRREADGAERGSGDTTRVRTDAYGTDSAGREPAGQLGALRSRAPDLRERPAGRAKT